MAIKPLRDPRPADSTRIGTARNDVVLWEAPEATRLPDDWWRLVDRTEHVSLCGPAAAVSTHATPADALTAAAGDGPLMAVLARRSVTGWWLCRGMRAHR
jgi:hypothetical protein